MNRQTHLSEHPCNGIVFECLNDLPRMSRHARVRMRQRAIPETVVTWLRRYGTRHFDGHGGLILYFDQQARTRVENFEDLDLVHAFRDKLDAYLVISLASCRVSTVGRRYRRIRR